MGCVLYPEVLARYSQYDRPVYQNSRIPWFGTYELIKPVPLKNEFFATQELLHHILNMSVELLKDTYIKSIYSHSLQKDYANDPKYKLGLFTAGVIDKFNHMVKIYKYYARPEIYEESTMNEAKHKHITYSITQGYQIMQSDYNEIRVETELFFNQVAAANKRGHTGDAQSNLDDFKGDMTEEDWHKMSKADQDNKIAEYKAIYGGGRRSMDARRSSEGKSQKVKFSLDAAQEEYKRSLRYQKWAEKWDGFDSKIEGIEISSPLEKLRQNRSNFLGVNPF